MSAFPINCELLESKTLFLIMSMSVCVWVCAHKSWCPQTSGDPVSPTAGVTSDCESPIEPALQP